MDCTKLVILIAVLGAFASAYQSPKSSEKLPFSSQRRHHHSGSAENNLSYKKRLDDEDALKQKADPENDYETDGETEAADAGPDSSGESGLPSLPTPGTYIPSNCSTCARREELRRRSLEVIKDQILSKLGMQQAPNITGRLPPRIPPLDHLLDMYGMQGDAPGGPFQPGPVYDEEEDDFHARTEKVIAFAQQLPHVRQALRRTESGTTRGMESMYFKFSEKVMRSSKVDKAHLWLYLQHNGHSHHHHNHHSHHRSQGKHHASNATVWIHIYKVVRVPDGESPILNPVRATRVALPTPEEVKSGKSSGGWVSIELRKVVADWFRWPEENFGLVVQAMLGDASSPAPNGKQPVVSSGLPSPFTIVTDPSQADGSLVPFVEVVTTDGRKQRTKRTIGLNCDETSSERRCCRYPLTVDFVEFGWDWIIAPKKYEANYCSGECPYVFLQKYPHTHIVQQANPAGTAGPCCAPRKMSSISMLYFDNEFNIIYGNLPGMVVDRCGCS